MTKLLIKNISKLYGFDTMPQSFKKGEALSVLNMMENAYVLIEGGTIRAFGDMSDAPLDIEQQIDATDRLVLPCWCDSHTHIVFAESREQEYLARIQGKSYEEIAQNGGGILNSAKKLRAKSENELYHNAESRLKEVMRLGTGAIEIKSGYGLDFDSEMKMLRVIKRLKSNFDIPIKSTFLAAHAIPPEYKHDRQAYIDLIINKMLPYVVEHQLADYIDVFCDEGFFTVAETAQLLKAGSKFGLKSKIHANELANSGGVQVGIEFGAISVDHLEQIEAPEIEALSKSKTIPTVLPNVSFFLKMRYAPSRDMIDSGLGIAIASDYNPGSSPSGNMNLAVAIACTQMRLTPAEAVNAATINGSYAMELEDQVGSIAVGKLANIIITKPAKNIETLPYYFGSNFIDQVLINGKIID